MQSFNIVIFGKCAAFGENGGSQPIGPGEAFGEGALALKSPFDEDRGNGEAVPDVAALDVQTMQPCLILRLNVPRLQVVSDIAHRAVGEMPG